MISKLLAQNVIQIKFNFQQFNVVNKQLDSHTDDIQLVSVVSKKSFHLFGLRDRP